MIAKNQTKQIKRKNKTKLIKVDKAILHIKFSRNNTLVNLTDINGNTLFISSGGGGGDFKNTKKGSPSACTSAINKVFTVADARGVKDMSVYVRGFSIARDDGIRKAVDCSSLYRIPISTFKDNTPIAHGGVRAPKQRRL